MPELGVDDPMRATLPELLAHIRQCRKRLPDREEGTNNYSRLDAIILPLWKIHMNIHTDYTGPLEGPVDFFPPSAYDVLIEIKPEDLKMIISDIMGVEYLSPGLPPTWPLQGRLYGIRKRVIFTIPVSIDDKSVNTHFIFDTGAPASYIAKSVLDALGVEEWKLGYKTPRLNGVLFEVNVSDSQPEPCNFKGLNLLGMDFLRTIRGTLHIDMLTETLTIESQTKYEKSV